MKIVLFNQFTKKVLQIFVWWYIIILGSGNVTDNVPDNGTDNDTGIQSKKER